MSANTLYTLEAANMFLGKEATDQSNALHLKLTEVKLPSIEEQYADHRGLGAPVGIEIDTVINRLECAFAIVGIDPQIATLPLSWFEDHQWFFFYGVVRDRLTGDAIQARAQMRGRLGRVDPQNWRRGDVMHTNGQIRAITYYQFEIGGARMYLWDFYNNVFYIGDDNRMAVTNDLLHIPSFAPVNEGGAPQNFVVTPTV